MTDPALTPEEIEILLAYARRKYRDERWPFALELRPVREALAKLDQRPKPAPPPEARPYVPSTVMQKVRRR